MTTDIVPDDFADDMETFFYTEKDTRLIHEARLFEGFVLVRPVAPAFHSIIMRFTHPEFSGRFEEYQGDHDAIRNMIWGGTSEIAVEIT